MISGLVVGFGETVATCPREAGRSTQTERVKPWAGGGTSPSCSNIAGTMWNCTSGTGSSSEVR